MVQYGVGMRTSSPGSSRVAKVWKTACLPPLVISTWAGSTPKPLSRAVLAATASRSSGRPAAGVYFWYRGTAQARAAASTM